MNYQLLIESYSFGTTLSSQEIEILSLELETQIMNMKISTDFACFKSAPSHICKEKLFKHLVWLREPTCDFCPFINMSRGFNNWLCFWVYENII